MLRSGTTKVAKEELDGVNNQKTIWNFNVENIVASLLNETKTNSTYLIGHLRKLCGRWF